MKHYPSKKRFQILLATKEEYKDGLIMSWNSFRENRSLTDEKKISIEVHKAKMGLRHLYMYK